MSEQRGDGAPKVIGQIAGATPSPDTLPPTPIITDAVTAEDLLHHRAGRRPPGPAPRKLTDLDRDPDADVS